MVNHNLRQARIDAGYPTIEQFARAAKVHHTVIKGCELETSLPRKKTAQRISQTLDKPQDYLFPNGIAPPVGGSIYGVPHKKIKKNANPKKVNEKIRNFRITTNQTLEQLASKIGIHKS